MNVKDLTKSKELSHNTEMKLHTKLRISIKNIETGEDMYIYTDKNHVLDFRPLQHSDLRLDIINIKDRECAFITEPSKKELLTKAIYSSMQNTRYVDVCNIHPLTGELELNKDFSLTLFKLKGEELPVDELFSAYKKLLKSDAKEEDKEFLELLEGEEYLFKEIIHSVVIDMEHISKHNSFKYTHNLIGIENKNELQCLYENADGKVKRIVQDKDVMKYINDLKTKYVYEITFEDIALKCQMIEKEDSGVQTIVRNCSNELDKLYIVAEIGDVISGIEMDNEGNTRFIGARDDEIVDESEWITNEGIMKDIKMSFRRSFFNREHTFDYNTSLKVPDFKQIESDISSIITDVIQTFLKREKKELTYDEVKKKYEVFFKHVINRLINKILINYFTVFGYRHQIDKLVGYEILPETPITLLRDYEYFSLEGKKEVIGFSISYLKKVDTSVKTIRDITE